MRAVNFLVILVINLSFNALFAVPEGFLIALFWQWFIVPIFHLPLLSVPQALGLALVIVTITHQDIQDKKGDDLVEKILNTLLANVMNLCVLGILGWALHLIFF